MFKHLLSLGFVLIACYILHPVSVFAEEKSSADIETARFETMEAEIMEVEELKEPLGSAIFTVKDLVSGQIARFFADPYLSLIQSGGETILAGDVLGGSKATIIYRQSQNRDIPEIMFAQISGSYY